MFWQRILQACMPSTSCVRNLISIAGAPGDPQQSHAQALPSLRSVAYKQRNLIGRVFCRLKDFRRIATRYDKLACSFTAAVRPSWPAIDSRRVEAAIAGVGHLCAAETAPGTAARAAGIALAGRLARLAEHVLGIGRAAAATRQDPHRDGRPALRDVAGLATPAACARDLRLAAAGRQPKQCYQRSIACPPTDTCSGPHRSVMRTTSPGQYSRKGRTQAPMPRLV